MQTSPVFCLSLALLLPACLYAPEPMPEVVTEAPILEARNLVVEDIDAVMPTDLLVLSGDGYVVLDGFRSRALHLEGREPAHVEIPTSAAWGEPVRLALRAGGGYWLADPGSRHREPALIGLESDGYPGLVLPLALPGDAVAALRPLVVAEQADDLVVGDRLGRLAWLDPKNGALRALLTEDAEGQPLGPITDLAVLANGHLLAVDAGTARIHLIVGHKVQRSIGRYGLWAGTLKKPKSVAVTEGGALLVADSALGVLQVFAQDGTFIALVGSEGLPVRFEQITAVRSVGSGRYLALDSATARVSSFELDPSALALAAGRSTVRRMRFQLEDPSDDVAGAGGRQCRQCHDGFVNDSRSVWDPAAQHHPVDIVPERDLPAFFPLSDDGELVCATCHSPHGVVDAAEAAGVLEEEGRLALVRHGGAETGFLRMDLVDSALCVACHEAAAHEAALSRLDLPGGAHPVGADLERAMAKRPGWSMERVAAWDSFPDEMRRGCMGCHTPHSGRDEPLLRSADDGSLCAVCHPDKASERDNHSLGQHIGRDVPTPRRAAQLVEARGGGVLCRTCHDLVGGATDALLRRPDDGGPLCVVCHDERKGLTRAPHGKIQGSRGLPCLRCHDVHGGPSDRHLLKLQPRGEGDPTGCGECHGRGAPNEPTDARPGRLGHPIIDQPGGVPQTDPPLLGCPSCHDPHLARPEDATKCRACHAEVAEVHTHGGHADVACKDCHPAHTEPPPARGTLAELNPLSQGCLRCHSPDTERDDAPIVDEYEHPAPVFLPDGGRWAPRGALPLYDAVGKQVEQGANGDLTCGSCHSTHDARERTDWKESCVACHGRDALAWYLYFHKPEKRGRGARKGQP